MKKILVTSVGSEIASSIIKSLRKSDLDLQIIGVDANPFNAGTPRCNRFYTIPRVNDPDYSRALLQICEKEKIDLAIPANDIELMPFARLRTSVHSKTHFLVSTPEMIQICRNKHSTFRFFKEHNFPFVETATYEELNLFLKKADFPIIAKPISGSGSLGVYLLQSEKDLMKIENIENYVFQRYIPSNGHSLFLNNEELSVQVLAGKNKDILGILMAYTQLKNGMPTKIEPFHNAGLESLIRNIGSALIEKGLLGPCNLQGKMTPSGPMFFELNARFTGISAVRARLNFNECEAMIRNILLDEPLPAIKKILVPNYDKVICRYYEEVLIDKTSAKNHLDWR